ncbi:hypothetical protein EYR40_009454 [Pleurotus pulmonarius]|nr:hypothetical protein EYR38_009446 [Pleurotus pulmonarius]KAF4590857.1 hypothetical protein EYR40_009454 [Pleurotus pulmonarius]
MPKKDPIIVTDTHVLLQRLVRREAKIPLPLDIFHELLLHLGPRDLIYMSRVNKTMRKFLLERDSYWKRARLSFPMTIPPPKMTSEYHNIVLFFGGGECTREGQLENNIYRKNWVHDTDLQYCAAKALSRNKTVPERWNVATVPLPELKASWEKKANDLNEIMETAQERIDWCRKYNNIAHEFFHLNRRILWNFQRGEKKERQQVAGRKRIVQCVDSLSADLIRLNKTKWKLLLKEALEEEEYNRKVKSIYYTKQPILGCIKCPKRFFDSDGLIDHTSSKHPEMKEEMMALLTKSSRKRCQVCGSHRKRFTPAGLQEHLKKKHNITSTS